MYEFEYEFKYNMRDAMTPLPRHVCHARARACITYTLVIMPGDTWRGYLCSSRFCERAEIHAHIYVPARRGVIGVETIFSSLRARKIALEDADVQAEIRVKVIGLMRDFYCWMMEGLEWM